MTGPPFSGPLGPLCTESHAIFLPGSGWSWECHHLHAYSHLDKLGMLWESCGLTFPAPSTPSCPPAEGKVDRDRSGYLPDILDYRLPDCRTQFVRLKAHVSEMMVSSSGASQRNMLSPVLFRLYTSDFNTAIVECLNRGQEENYRGLISNFVTWCSWTVPRPRRLGLGTSQKSSLPLLTISIEISNSINYYSRYKTSHFIFRHVTRVLMSWQ